MDYLVTCNDYLLVEPMFLNTKLGNGVQVKDVNKSRKSIVQGIIKKTFNRSKYCEGHVVWFPLYSGEEVDIDDKKYVLIRADDVMMKETEEETDGQKSTDSKATKKS